MQIIQIKVDDSHLKVVLNLLNNLKQDVVKGVSIIEHDDKHSKKDDIQLLDELFEQSNNKIKVTKELAIDTSEMLA